MQIAVASQVVRECGGHTEPAACWVSAAGLNRKSQLGPALGAADLNFIPGGSWVLLSCASHQCQVGQRKNGLWVRSSAGRRRAAEQTGSGTNSGSFIDGVWVVIGIQMRSVTCFEPRSQTAGCAKAAAAALLLGLLP